MTISAENSAVQAAHFDPYDVELNADPYPMFRRLREEAPLYYNEQHDFYALSRFADVNKALVDHETFSSARGAIVELIKANIEIPPGDSDFRGSADPRHPPQAVGPDVHPTQDQRTGAQDPRVLCAAAWTRWSGADRFDFVTDLGAQMPMQVISALLGIPEEDQEMIRDHANAQMRTEAGKPMEADGFVTGELFEAYIDWRVDHPSDDIMTELLNAEFVDETGTIRQLTREELLTYLNVVAGAGNETTTRLIGWAGKVLAEHPDQRRELVENPSLIPQAVEELLRFEPPAPHVARYVTRDVEYYGQTVPEGSVMMMLIGAAVRDHRQFPPDGDVFDIHREARQHLAFSVGTHYCLGSALARLEGRIALEEILKRFPEWDVDMANASLSPTSTVRGWDSMPRCSQVKSVPTNDELR